MKQQLPGQGERQLNLYGVEAGAWQDRTGQTGGQMAMQVDQKQKYSYLNILFVLEKEWYVF